MKCTIIIVNYVKISVKSDGDFFKISMLFFLMKKYSHFGRPKVMVFLYFTVPLTKLIIISTCQYIQY